MEVGFVSGKPQNYRSVGQEPLGLGTHPFIRIGVGIRGYTSAGATASFLIYYQVALSEDSEVEGYSGTIPYNVTLIRVELGFGFGLKRE